MITREKALAYHAEGRPGKIKVVPTKPTETQEDLSLAYSPGVAEPCREIAKDPSQINRVLPRRHPISGDRVCPINGDIDHHIQHRTLNVHRRFKKRHTHSHELQKTTNYRRAPNYYRIGCTETSPPISVWVGRLCDDAGGVARPGRALPSRP